MENPAWILSRFQTGMDNRIYMYMYMQPIIFIYMSKLLPPVVKSNFLLFEGNHTSTHNLLLYKWPVIIWCKYSTYA